MLAYIWAEDSEHHIGINGGLPWHLPNDLAYFKRQTLGHPMIMGKRTFDSFPTLLPGRLHVVLTHSIEFEKEYADNDQVVVVHDEDDLRKWLEEHDSEMTFVIGGASLFEMFKDDVDLLYVTKIKGKFEADTTMPKLEMDRFALKCEEKGMTDERNKYQHTFFVYERK
ncbi:dihydrofolate reductase [Ligilactobacillus sp.]|uniref:dihydrofolate reductase n=1 Tax=Ligilactobacillus sp. TaxID=2767921 RepID=UPI002FDF9432